MTNTLNILGVGVGYPHNSIDNQMLATFSSGASASGIFAQTGIETRPTALPFDYLRATLNRDPWQSRDLAKAEILEMTLTAANSALKRAGISAEEVGLIIGENSTPLETTPSEAQRLGKALSLKVPAYDVQSSSTSLLLFLNVLSRWLDKSLPKYTLCISTNTPTQRVDYSKGREGWYFGDASAAMVISSEVSGKLRVDNVTYRTALEAQDPARFDLYGPAELKSHALKYIYESSKKLLGQAEKDGLIQSSRTKMICSQLSPVDMERIFAPYKSSLLSNAKISGYSLSTSSLSVLADAWDQISVGESVVVVETGLGLGEGYASIGA